MYQTTIKKSVELVGIGLHKGSPVRLKLEPLDANSGIVFYRSDVDVSIPLIPSNVVDTKMATVIGKEGYVISTIEHLLSAIYAYGIDNLRVIVNADEIPVMDGSSASFCMLLDEAGVIEQDAPKRIMRIKKEIIVQEGEKYVKLSPSPDLKYDFTIKFPHPVISKQEYVLEFTKESYKNEIARARTFGFLHEVQYLRSKGLALGGSLENAIVLDEKKILNPEGLRFPDEFVRHKILDAIGDMSLIGMNFIGNYEAMAGSHDLNHKLTLELLKDAENYEVIELVGEKAKELEKAYA
ncbi:MAG: UDP-3-O-acyl-N-acetylglucosamine deacetylase [Epsilonproteobacteria bacterium]|nr:UDP-3-O-acyl-N-acetylglucosamine deacetylase [Campylobacterota bacterium]OIO13422.1 MAG: UDP-3-O-[3-hydroxymyristoyl] N-acetylglucosamine deacetylase [Helicobacteraceae bacterium CG1_02_36_14]PIP09877.1 MAG: UDP-3-O-[3-hydroxymyristoyl] N-acetylglucosamine deacetylase [Sulfurimonas sp. CG23_combo_of_CG06-09_8_20_14_all_36_33]PIS24093.1 MAG: UDP-3-O-[3-hydroxymyristoyl] N-acetylglucosamine deacetylase [Sulfurimonas sp. CG08_land_8_20_14_0_20_36_33]PIU35577.1 MAG: UDP-3-O-[3-hydroxymyristoyl] 